jgi:hypothetical protein
MPAMADLVEDKVAMQTEPLEPQELLDKDLAVEDLVDQDLVRRVVVVVLGLQEVMQLIKQAQLVKAVTVESDFNTVYPDPMYSMQAVVAAEQT